MSVTTPYRSESSMEFLNKTMEMNMKLGTFVVKLPVKYKAIYGDDMAKTGLAALRLLQTGNGIYLSKNTTQAAFDERASLFSRAKGYIYNIPTTYRLCVKIRIETEKPDAETKAKWIRQSEALVSLCNECVDLIGGIIKSDRKRYNEYCRNTKEIVGDEP